MDITGNIILITGGSSGIGLELLKYFYHLDNKIIIVGRNLEKLKNIQIQYPKIDIFQCELSQQAEIERLSEYIKKNHPNLNLLFNNAAIQYNYDLKSDSDLIEKIDYELNVNLNSLIKISYLLLPILLKNPKSAIINLSSGLAISPKKSAPVYCASKAAIHSFTKSLRYQLEGTHVRVIEIIPPIVDTPMTEGRGKNKLSPENLVIEFIRGFKKNKEELYIGKSKILKFIHRISPKIADKILKNG